MGGSDEDDQGLPSALPSRLHWRTQKISGGDDLAVPTRARPIGGVKTDLQLTAIAERQAKAMAASGIMDYNVAGSFASGVSGSTSRHGGGHDRRAGKRRPAPRRSICGGDLAGP